MVYAAMVGALGTLAPSRPNLFRFHAVFGKNLVKVFALNLGLYKKSWIRHCIVCI